MIFFSDRRPFNDPCFTIVGFPTIQMLRSLAVQRSLFSNRWLFNNPLFGSLAVQVSVLTSVGRSTICFYDCWPFNNLFLRSLADQRSFFCDFCPVNDTFFEWLAIQRSHFHDRRSSNDPNLAIIGRWTIQFLGSLAVKRFFFESLAFQLSHFYDWLLAIQRYLFYDRWPSSNDPFFTRSLAVQRSLF